MGKETKLERTGRREKGGENWHKRRIAPNSIFHKFKGPVVRLDKTGRILDILNCDFNGWDGLIDKSLPGLLLDGFIQNFYRVRDLVLAGGCPQQFTFFINLSSPAQALRCRVIKDSDDVVIIVEGISCTIEIKRF